MASCTSYNPHNPNSDQTCRDVHRCAFMPVMLNFLPVMGLVSPCSKHLKTMFKCEAASVPYSMIDAFTVGYPRDWS